MRIKVVKTDNSTYTYFGDCTDQLKELMGDFVSRAYIELYSSDTDSEYNKTLSRDLFEKIISNYEKKKSFDFDAFSILIVFKNKKVVKISSSEWGTIVNSKITEI